MPQLAIRDLRKSFKDVVVLDGVTLDVEPGEIVCVFGPALSLYSLDEVLW